MTRRGLIAGACALALCVLVVVMLVRQRPPEGMRPEDVAQADAARAFFASGPSVPIEAARSGEVLGPDDRVVAALLAGLTIPEQTSTSQPAAEVRAALFRRVAEWLALRSAADADAYADWMRGRGYKLALELGGPDLPATLRDDIRKQDYAYFTDGGTMPADIAPIEYFRVCFLEHLRRKSGMMRPRAIAGAPEAVRAAFFDVDARSVAAASFPLQRWAGSGPWFGDWSGGDVAHWRPPVSIAEVQRRDGRSLEAVVCLGVRGWDGRWVPTKVWAYWDPKGEDWHFRQISMGNTLDFGFSFVR